MQARIKTLILRAREVEVGDYLLLDEAGPVLTVKTVRNKGNFRVFTFTNGQVRWVLKRRTLSVRRAVENTPSKEPK